MLKSAMRIGLVLKLDEAHHLCKETTAKGSEIMELSTSLNR